MNLRDALDLSITKQARCKAGAGDPAEDGEERPPMWVAKLSIITDFDSDELYGVIEIQAFGSDDWTAFADLAPEVQQAIAGCDWEPLDQGHPLYLLATEADQGE